jgi:predicted RNase H-like nuclease
MTTGIVLAGIDLAWIGEKNPTAVCIGELAGRTLTVGAIEPAIFGLKNIGDYLSSVGALTGVAIDAPLVIPNTTGIRECERQIGQQYSARKIACHSANQTLFPDAFSVALANQLRSAGFEHLGASDGRWQIECYPHPAILEIFGLKERLKYKKGRVADKRQGQAVLASLIEKLTDNDTLNLAIPMEFSACINPQRISQLKGPELKSNEDALDSIICLYIAGLYQIGAAGKVFGRVNEGYIWVPSSAVIAVGELLKYREPDFRSGSTKTT